MFVIRKSQMDTNEFLRAVQTMPLVSVDLIIRDGEGKVLLGKRQNAPAKGFWFVPGGRIRKGERISAALTRVALAELGTVLEDLRLHGVYDHLYEDNFAEIAGIATQYVAVAFHCRLPAGSTIVLDPQHSEVRWADVREICNDSSVHENTRNYFRDGAGFRAD